MTNFDDFLNEQLQDEEVKKEYDALDEEFKKVKIYFYGNLCIECNVN